MRADMITVHHLNDSRSQRVLWLLEELGLPYEIRRYQRDPQTMTLDAGKPVRNASIWQREADRKKITGLPGLALALKGDGTLTTSDPKAVGIALDAPALPGMTGAERLQLRRYYSPQTSRGGTDWENRVRWDSARALGYD